ncbi:MAG: UDP-N-acetylmuramoyl-L-alanyl-D-glutamate--2,6-diaminopimelate ligase [Olsenella sp.]|nr:UDP-N-acetylmuramoyl-L-alanyl-D-glutamate--2,6-diaminopimelate ligase [Olsenella sp.]
MDITLTQIAALLEGEGLLVRAENLDGAAGETPVTGADCDSRKAAPGHVFVCKGAAFKPAYLASALDAGCVAYLADEEHAPELAAAHPGVPLLVASDLRRAMADLSAAAWGHPDERLSVVGITGTKGKSSTAYMLRAILDADADEPHAGAGEPRAAMLGSIETFDGVERMESVNTTPEAPDLWRHFANAAASGLTHMVMEVSSQALKYDRVRGLALDVAAFLNIGTDHISPLEHPSWEDYFESKLRIFDQAKVAVVNLGSDHADEILARAARCERVITCSSAAADSAAPGDPAAGATPVGPNGTAADVWASDLASSHGTQSFVAHTPSWEGPVTLPMPGRFNVDNALVAIAVCEALGLGHEQVSAGLARASVPGRMELVTTSDHKVTGIVDFAHNKMSFANFFPAVRREFPRARVISVFGTTGDKGLERRHELPVEAAPYSDLMIFTKDDPGFEPVEDICAALEAATPGGTSTETIPDRVEAIDHAVDLAFASDGETVICLVGRGAEGLMHENGKLTPYPLDIDLLRQSFARYDRAVCE